MSQQRRLIAYLVVVHAGVGAVVAWLAFSNPLLLIPGEIAFAVSLLTGIVLVRRSHRQFEFARASSQLIAESEYTSRFLPVGEPAVDGLIAIYNTLVDRLRDERTRLQEQHHFFSHVLRVSPSGIVIGDFDDRVTDVNPAAERLLDQRIPDLVGRRLDEIGSPLVREALEVEPGDARVVTLASARRFKCHHGTFIDRGFRRRFLLIEELTDELRQAERAAYEKLIRVMAHEVNNSVAASNSLLHSSLNYAAQLDADSRADFEQALGIVIGRTDELNRFMRRFADVFRLPKPSRRQENLVAIVDATLRLVRARPEASSVSWRREVCGEPLTVPCDRGQLEQALINILQNAMEAALPAGAVMVRLGDDRGRPVLVIADNGPGISAEVRDNLFTPFFSTKPHGQGIGLTLVQEILSGHGFEYALDRADGWTRFTIRF